MTSLQMIDHLPDIELVSLSSKSLSDIIHLKI